MVVVFQEESSSPDDMEDDDDVFVEVVFIEEEEDDDDDDSVSFRHIGILDSFVLKRMYLLTCFFFFACVCVLTLLEDQTKQFNGPETLSLLSKQHNELSEILSTEARNTFQNIPKTIIWPACDSRCMRMHSWDSYIRVSYESPPFVFSLYR